MIKENDFVVLTEKVNGIEKNSVGYVKKVTKTYAKVFFIGKLKEIDIELTRFQYKVVTD